MGRQAGQGREPGIVSLGFDWLSLMVLRSSISLSMTVPPSTRAPPGRRGYLPT